MQFIYNYFSIFLQDLTSFVVFLTMVIGMAVSKPLWSTIINNNDVHSTPEINAQYLAAYQDTRSPYYVYNVLHRYVKYSYNN